MTLIQKLINSFKQMLLIKYHIKISLLKNQKNVQYVTIILKKSKLKNSLDMDTKY